MDVGWFTPLLSAESLVALASVGVALLIYLATKIQLESKQNAKEHAELRRAIERLADSMDRRLDQILAYLPLRHATKDD